MLSTYLPLGLRKELLATPPAVPAGKARVQETALLYADLAGFTPLTEAFAQAGPEGVEALAAVLNRVFGGLLDRLYAFGGDLVKFSGDALTCMWPREGDSPGDVLARALAAALAMQEQMQEHPSVETPAGPFPLSMRVGLALGRVVTSMAGAEARRFFLALGPALRSAARAQSRARPGGIALDARARAALSGVVTCDRAGRLMRVLGPLPAPAAALPPPLPDGQACPFLLPALVQRLQATPESFLAEFRRVLPLFVSFESLGVGGLRRYIGRVLPIIESCGGYLLEVEIGDKGCLLVVLFGAPLSHEDDAAQAVACALALRDLPETRGMGITCGTLFTGSLGNAFRRQYTAIGDEMNVAARLMEAAGDAILISGRVRRAAGERFLYGPARQLALKGKEVQVIAFPLLGPRPRPGGEFAIPQGELVGRPREQAFLDEAIAQVRSGRGMVLGIVGPAGIGKTRLAGELLRRWNARGGAGHFGAATASARQQPYFPWSALLRSLLALYGDGPDPAGLREALDTLHPDLQLRLPLLADVLGWAMPDNDFTRPLDARRRQEATLALVAEIVRRRAQEAPLLLLLEDVHWMDRPSWELALAVGRAVEDLPVLLCLVGRPEEEEGAEVASLWSQMARLPHYRSLPLGELTADEIVSLARQELQAATLSEEIGRLLAERSQGNPLFVQEIVRALVEGGAVTVEAGQARLGRPLEEVAIPDTIQGVVLSRLDRLDEPTKLTLKVAAVIGRTFSVPVLRGVHPAPPEEQELGRQLGQMERLSIVRIESREPYPSYLFHHAITQEVAYSTLLSAQRGALHRRVAEWYERAFADNLAPHYGLLAHHYERAGLEDRWVLYLGRMAEEAGRRYAPDVAIEAYGRLRSVLERWAAGDPAERAGRVARMVELDPSWGRDALPEKEARRPAASPEERLFRARLRAALGLADALDLRGRWGEERVLLESLLPLVERADDRALTIAVGVRRAALALNSGDLEAGLHLADKVLELARQEGDLATQAYMLNARGRAAELRGEIEEARREARRALRLARRAQDNRNAGIALILLGNACNAMQQPARAARYFEKAVAAQRAAGDRSWELVALNNLGIAWIQSGLWDRARECLEQVLAQARLIGDLEVELMAMANLGAVDLMLGRYDQAGARMERARVLFQKMGRQDAEAEALEYLAELALHRGEISQALAWASEARELRRALGLPFGGLLTYARILEEAGRWSEAWEAYRSLSRLVEQSQAGRPSADALAGLARCAMAGGDRAGAQSFLEEALRLLAGGEAQAEDAALIYLTGYRLFAALGLPERARDSLSRGRRLLRRQAARLADPQMRESFLYNVPVHRGILAAGESPSGPVHSHRSRR